VGVFNHAFSYTGGTMTDLGTLGGRSSYASGINDAGQIVGTADNGTAVRAFIYQSGTMTDLGALQTNGESHASAINNLGHVVGYATVAGHQHAFLHDGGSMLDLGTLGGSSSFATDINDAGVIVGYSDSGSGSHAFARVGGTMIDLGTLGGDFSRANAINNDGKIVGYSSIAGGAFHAFLYESGILTDLNDLIPTGTGWTLTTALDINDAGQIVGAGSFNGITSAYLLNPETGAVSTVPEPSSLALLALGAAAMFRRRRRC
jgi:probable HAF family extracellular repeat protein